MLNLNSAEFRNKVYGCWLGKNCGGTLGAPLEKAWGEPEPFDVWWYPKLQEGGIPNDDLEMQLVWLKALEEVGTDLKAADLARYWLDHIGYNWDEYGLSKTNLRLGLLPPVSGAYNNWFKDCMGCPIRSEIWACIAPGQPRIAARYAYEDAICDHAGGESVYGELFNAAIESAAFVVTDPKTLIEIGLSYVPPDSQTAKALAAALQAHASGVDWKAARQAVLTATPHHVAQYSPINMAFQVIGWLYGTDFGDAICKAVNCGYDTDCTGATLGSILGIIVGRSGLPDKWTQPLGETITTNESWGGVRHLTTGINPVPKNLDELTTRTIAMAERVLTAHGVSDAPLNPADLYADDSIRALWQANPMQIDFASGTIAVSVDYGDSPVIVPGTHKTIHTLLHNRHPDTIQVVCELRHPTPWNAAPITQTIEIKPEDSASLSWPLAIPEDCVENANVALLSVQAIHYPAQPAVPVVLVGAPRWRYTGPFPADGQTDRELFDRAFPPEETARPVRQPEDRGGHWHDLYGADNAVPLDTVFTQSGVIYAQTFLWSHEARTVWIADTATCPSKMWVNQVLMVQPFRYNKLRPDYRGDSESAVAVSLVKGWNEVLIKYVRDDQKPLFEAHLLISDATELRDGLPDIGRTRTPWDS